MNVRITTLFSIALSLIALIVFTDRASATARSIDHGGIYVGDVYVAPNQVVHGDITVIGGDATIEGTIDGNLTIIGGNPITRPGSTITGKVENIGGGDVVGIATPWGGSLDSMAVANLHIFWKICWSAIVLLFFLIFPARTRMALDRLEKHPGLCAAIGLVGWIAIAPLAILLICTLVLMPLVIVEGIALIAGIFIGKAALSLLVGRRLYEMMSPNTTAQPLIAIILGLALITAAEIVPLVGWMVSALIGLVGLGAAILSFVREGAFSGGTPAAAHPHAPIGGPPMTIG